jgi:predicted extracellular nuclease
MCCARDAGNRLLPSRTDLDGLEATSLDRTFAQTFTELATGERFTVAINHLKSKGSACDAVDDPDRGDGQGNCNLTRRAAADAEQRWLATDPTGSADPDVLLIGDFNAYAREDPITVLTASG